MLRQHGSFLFVGMAKDAYRFSLVTNKELSGRYGYLEWTDRETGLEHRLEIAPIENHSIVGLCNDLTEEQWGEIVDSGVLHIMGRKTSTRFYRDYSKESKGFDNYCLLKGVESGFSLLRSLGFEPGQNVLAIKIEK